MTWQVVDAPDGSPIELLLPDGGGGGVAGHSATSAAVSTTVEALPQRGGHSAIGYLIVERLASGEVRAVGEARWLHLNAPFAPCAECDDDEDSLFGWAVLSPSSCQAVADHPTLAVRASCNAAARLRWVELS